MENSNECKKNFVAIYDGSNAIEDLKVKHILSPNITFDVVLGYSIPLLVITFLINGRMYSNCPTEPGGNEVTHQRQTGVGSLAGQVL